FATVERAFEIAGSIDVIVNNAGYGLVGAVEELGEQQIRDQMDTNFYGAVWVTQAAVPYLRTQGSGHIVQISTVGAVGSLPLFSMYNASKWALEGFSASLADELRPFGISVTLAQMGGFDTDWAKSSMRFAHRVPAYDEIRTGILGMADYPDPANPPASAENPEWVEPAPEVAAAELLELV
ncbi:SDR family NAD(P)-dependent oxidoreductase, partial [Nocardia gipuzkoensis]